MTKTEKVAAVVCLAASAVMVGASFMSWLSVEGATVSGWDLVRHQRDVGANPFVVWNLMTSDSGSDVPFMTGWVTLLAGVWLAAWTGITVAIHARRDPGRLFKASAMIAVVAGAVFGLENVYFYVLGSSGTDVSLEPGLITLWSATVVASGALLVVLGQAAVPHRHGPTAHAAR